MGLKYSKTVIFGGCAINFGLLVDGTSSPQIVYSVHSLANQNPNSDSSWRDPEALHLPTEICTVGREVLTVRMSGPAPTADAAFAAVADSAFVYVFRTSTNQSVYCDKFVYDQTTGRLVNATQVRYRRSRKADLPLDRRDTFGSQDMNGRSFFEPTVELDFLHGLTPGRFDVAILPTELAGVTRWQFLAQNAESGKLVSYSILRSPDGGFDLEDSMDPDTGAVLPDSEFDLVDPAGAKLAVTSGLSLIRYDQQEWQTDEYGRVTLQKREMRAMAALAIGPEGKIATLDFGIGRDGRMTRIGETLTIAGPADLQGALRFNASIASIVAIPAIATGPALTVEAWVLPSTNAGEGAVIMASAADADVAFTLGLDAGIPYFLGPDGKTVAALEPLSIHDWTHVAASWDGTAILYVNGQPFTAANGVEGGRGTPPNAGYALGGAEGVTGDLAAIRLWKTARSQAQILATMNRVVTSAAPDWADLVGAWQGNAPAGNARFTTVPNSAATGAAADGALDGAQWVASRAPATRGAIPALYDENGLTAFTVYLDYAATEAPPQLYEGSDSLLHLYYSAKGSKQASAAHFAPIVQRSTYLGSWKAEDKAAPGNSQRGQLRFVARVASTAMNNPDPGVSFVEIKATNATYCQVTLRSDTGYVETWPKVPRALDDFCRVINGAAAQTSDNPIELAEDALMYDYRSVNVTPGRGQSGPVPGPGRGSAIFQVVCDELPDNGMPASVESVGGASPAVRGRSGSGGLWQPYPPLAGLDLSDLGQFVDILDGTAVDAYEGSLLIERDLAVEAWIRPVANQESDDQILFVFNRPGPTDEDDVAYIVGLRKGVPFAGSGEVVNAAAAVVPMDADWTHLAASYATHFGVQLAGQRYLDAGNAENTKTAEAVTLESWIRLDRIGGDQVVLAKTSLNDGTSWVLWVNDAGKLAFKVVQSTSTGTTERSVVSTTALTAGEWHHVAGVYDVSYERQVAITFESGNYVKIPEVESPPATGVSVMMWVKRLEDGNSTNEILFTSTDAEKNLTFSLNLFNGALQFFVSYGVQNFTVTDTRPLRRNDWVHVAGTFDPARGIALLVDGEPVGTTTRSAALAAPRAPAATGAEAAYSVGGLATQSTFIGTINEVSLWNRGLDIDQVRQKIQQPLAGNERGLCGYWRFNDLFGDTVMDLTGTANGTLVGGHFIRIDKGAFAQKLFVDGLMQVFERVVDPIVLSDARVTLGSGYFASYLQGAISESRLWNTGRMNWQINYFARETLSSNDRGLVSAWEFATGKGGIAFDSKSDNNALIRDGRVELTDEVLDAMWVLATFKAGWTFFINGEKVESLDGSLPPGGYGDKQATLGAFRLSNSISRFLTGQLSQVRVWSQQRTGAEIRGTMFTLLSGAEPGLAAFWGLDTGSGASLPDLSGWNNVGDWLGDGEPSWILSTAPVGVEEPVLQSTPGDTARPENMKSDYAASAGQYGQIDADARGSLYSSLMQTLALVDAADGEMARLADFKIGDLVLQFVGQAQVDPTLIGYIEGAPPLPAENLKLYPGDPLSYTGASTINVDETDSKTYRYAANRDVANVIDLSTRFGFNVEGETSAGIGIQQKVYSFGFAGGISAQMSETVGVLGEGSTSEETTVIAQKYMESRGGWYPNTYQIDAGVGDIFYPDNIGYALVRSGTADLFAMRIAGSGALVGYSARPNPDIPEDMNIIMFKIDDQYVKNGTLDGWIGFQPDSSYPNLQPGQHASYFKPLEAYAIKATIEREQHQRKAYFENFAAERLGQRADALKPDATDLADTAQSVVNTLIGVKAKAALSVDDWSARMARRSLANTYVWTAAGGLYSEQQQFMATREESSGGSYTMQSQAGIYTELTLSVGPTFNLDAMFGTTITTQTTKADQDSAQFSLTIDLMGDQRYIGLVEQDSGGDLLYSSKPSPGKVRGYRFMSFYRAPTKQNFEAFKSGVVDRDWLNGQGAYAGKYDPDALALRAALSNPNEVWRVLHRVTYVSRTPPASEQQGMSLTPDVRRPDEDSIVSNLVVIAELPATDAANPMPAISTEADTLLTLLAQNPVWGAALEAKRGEYKKDLMEFMRSFLGIPA